MHLLFKLWLAGVPVCALVVGIYLFPLLSREFPERSIRGPDCNRDGYVYANCTDDVDCPYEAECYRGCCRCESKYASRSKDPTDVCTYRRKDQLAAFLISFFVGGFGADWFYLSCGVGLYVGLGVLKLLTCGGCGVWWIVDFAYIAANKFPDGHGVDLAPW